MFVLHLSQTGIVSCDLKCNYTDSTVRSPVAREALLHSSSEPAASAQIMLLICRITAYYCNNGIHVASIIISGAHWTCRSVQMIN